jgi:hypothetical protein
MRKHANILVALAFATAMLQGCNHRQTARQRFTADVAKAEADGQKKIIDAQAKLDQVVAQNNKNLVGTQADAQKDASTNPNAPPPTQTPISPRRAATPKSRSPMRQYDVEKAKGRSSQTGCGRAL